MRAVINRYAAYNKRRDKYFTGVILLIRRRLFWNNIIQTLSVRHARALARSRETRGGARALFVALLHLLRPSPSSIASTAYSARWSRRPFQFSKSVRRDRGKFNALKGEGAAATAAAAAAATTATTATAVAVELDPPPPLNDSRKNDDCASARACTFRRTQCAKLLSVLFSRARSFLNLTRVIFVNTYPYLLLLSFVVVVVFRSAGMPVDVTITRIFATDYRWGNARYLSIPTR